MATRNLQNVSIIESVTVLSSIKNIITSTRNANVLIACNLGLFRLDKLSTLTPDDISIILPNDITISNPGRWLSINISSHTAEGWEIKGDQKIIVFTDTNLVEKSLEITIANSGGPESRPSIWFGGKAVSGSAPGFVFNNPDSDPQEMLVIDKDGVIIPRKHFYGMNAYRHSYSYAKRIYRVWNSGGTVIGGYAQELVQAEAWSAFNQYLSIASSDNTDLTHYHGTYTKRAGGSSPHVLCSRSKTVDMKDPINENIDSETVYDTGVLKYTGYIKAYNTENNAFANWQTVRETLGIGDPTGSLVNAIYSISKDTPLKINFYWELTPGNPAGKETLHIQNRTNATINIRVIPEAFYGFELSLTSIETEETSE